MDRIIIENLGKKFSIGTGKKQTALEKVVSIFSGKEPRENFENRYEVFCSLFTHNSTAIEGNTLTLLETSYLLFLLLL